MTTAYDNQKNAFGRQVQWLVEIDLPRCSRAYTTAPCAAADAGDGSRCWYSFSTCQDQANYSAATQTLRFCLNEVPWPDPASPAHPLLSKLISVPQRIEVDRLSTMPEKVMAEFVLDYTPIPPDQDKALYNTAKVGEFWSNLFARNPNLAGKALRVKRGFNAAGFLLADFAQVGASFKITNFKIEKNRAVIEAKSALADLDKAVVPWAISDDNTLQADLLTAGTTVYVRDAGEFPDPTVYTRNGVYVKIDAEIMLVTNRDTSADTLTVTRARCGTTAADHTAKDVSGLLTKTVRHVVPFVTDAGSSAPTGRNALYVIRDLLEWAGVASADVDTTSFDAIKNVHWPRADTYAIIEKSTEIVKLLQNIRDARGIIVYLDSSLKWAAACYAPGSTPAADLTDDNFKDGQTTAWVDDEKRITRVSFWYDPDVEQAGGSSDFGRCVPVHRHGSRRRE